jgi:hypothetical protein
MKRFAAIAVIPLFAGFLFAQTRTETTTTTTWNGTLVDATCQNSHSEHHSSSTQTNPDQSVTTKSESSRSETVNCPVTTTTTTFGLLTPEGRYIRFDEPSNTRVIEIVKTNKGWNKYITERAPLPVKVVGVANGDVAVVQSIDTVTAGPGPTVVGESSRVVETPKGAPMQDVMFDVRYNNDQGKLLVTANGVSFEDISNAKHSRSWSYAQIKELKRENNNEIKIEPYSGDKYEFKVGGPFMSDTVYNMIADRIVAARAH